ncbi:RpiB/LacA/LacB family sugar-phosphate isomerase [Candidatus Dojkabacteria bacterium]|uniref:RpiB/LacA/LacB family sugar-phosphate isomerase n=1 Tax=Candidatus Dojkabacteria bacterium TaxID=2099670 RepID=A0A955LA66_9BACT|nr:RpiB/LacA/LacB family sugar-phosphate isomerase [Candidatus Dojkabacteria bacterium]
MKVFIGSDHGGFELKKQIIEAISDMYEVEDLGPFELNPDDDYPDYAKKVAESIAREDAARGVLICRSGNGVAIAANKIKGAYAAVCFSKHHAEMAVIDDNANICCLDADYEGENPVEIVKSFLSSEFAGMETRHGRRFQKIQEMEKRD